VTSESISNANELLSANLHEVFEERDPEARWAAIQRTYSEDIRFIDGAGEFVGWQAVNDRAQQLLDATPTQCSWRKARGTSTATPQPWPGAWVRPAAPWWPEGSTFSRSATAA
jgi:hypothetical protein